MNQWNNTQNTTWGAQQTATPQQSYTQPTQQYAQPAPQMQQNVQHSYPNVPVQNMQQDEDLAVDWNAPITEDEKEFILLPQGIYPFMVKGFERTHSKNQKPMMKVSLVVNANGVEKEMFLYLLYTQKMMWKVGQFFVCIGLKQKGVEFLPDWNQVPGRTGLVEVNVEKSNRGNDINTLGNLVVG